MRTCADVLGCFDSTEILSLRNIKAVLLIRSNRNHIVCFSLSPLPFPHFFCTVPHLICSFLNCLSDASPISPSSNRSASWCPSPPAPTSHGQVTWIPSAHLPQVSLLKPGESGQGEGHGTKRDCLDNLGWTGSINWFPLLSFLFFILIFAFK